VAELPTRVLRKYLFWFTIILVTGMFLEYVGVLRGASDAVRAVLYKDAFIYDSDARDLRDFGQVRINLFTQEPSHVAKMMGLMVFAWFAVRGTRQGFFGAIALFVVGLVLTLSATLFSALAVLLAVGGLLWIAARADHATAKWKFDALITLSTTLAILAVFFLDPIASFLPGSRADQIANMTDNSAIERIFAPVQIAIESMRENPFGALASVSRNITPIPSCKSMAIFRPMISIAHRNSRIHLAGTMPCAKALPPMASSALWPSFLSCACLPRGLFPVFGAVFTMLFMIDLVSRLAHLGLCCAISWANRASHPSQRAKRMVRARTGPARRSAARGPATQPFDIPPGLTPYRQRKPRFVVKAIATPSNGISASMLEAALSHDGHTFADVSVIAGRRLPHGWKGQCASYIEFSKVPSLKLMGQVNTLGFYREALKRLKADLRSPDLTDIYIANTDNILSNHLVRWAERNQHVRLSVLAEGFMNYQDITVANRAGWRWALCRWRRGWPGCAIQAADALVRFV
jgi:hypothetical protein